MKLSYGGVLHARWGVYLLFTTNRHVLPYPVRNTILVNKNTQYFVVLVKQALKEVNAYWMRKDCYLRFLMKIC